jgi:hypothetical protein
MNFSYGWQEIDDINTTFYEAVPGPLLSYTTNAFTVAPQSAGSEIGFSFSQLTFPNNLVAETVGRFYITVSLYDPNNVLQASYNIGPNQGATLSPYINENALSGPYTITVQGFVVPSSTTNSYVGSYPITFTLNVSYQVAVEDNLPTYLLVERALYMYLTADGWPFHAVLDLLDNPDTPLAYDTNNAMTGTRYAAIPTIHAF